MKSIFASGKWCDSEVHITGELQSVKWKDIRIAWSQDTVLRRWIQPHIIMRNVGSRLLGNVALGQAPQWDGRGKRRKKEARGSQKTFPPLQSTAQLALLPALRKGREFRHETCPSSRAPRASRLSRVPNPLSVPFERLPRRLIFLLFHPFFAFYYGAWSHAIKNGAIEPKI